MNNKNNNKLNKSNSGIVKQQSIAYSGPIPDPNSLEHYGSINESFPERIMQMAEKQQDHRIEMEKKEIRLKEEQIKIEESYNNKILKYLSRGQLLNFATNTLELISSIYSYTNANSSDAPVLAYILVSIFCIHTGTNVYKYLTNDNNKTDKMAE